jgi:hypothetical protein
MESQRPTPASVRFPPALRDRIRAQAAAEHRTFSGTVLHLVRIALAHDHDRDDECGRDDDVDPDEVERLHALYHATISGKR